MRRFGKNVPRRVGSGGYDNAANLTSSSSVSTRRPCRRCRWYISSCHGLSNGVRARLQVGKGKVTADIGCGRLGDTRGASQGDGEAGHWGTGHVLAIQNRARDGGGGRLSSTAIAKVTVMVMAAKIAVVMMAVLSDRWAIQ